MHYHSKNLVKYPEEGGQLKEGVAIAKMVKYGLDNEYGPYWHVTVRCPRAQGSEPSGESGQNRVFSSEWTAGQRLASRQGEKVS